jgi:two-component system response regulator YesN
VIADIVMPGIDGIDLLKETRKAGICSWFIMLTAMSHFDYARDALQINSAISHESLLVYVQQAIHELIRQMKEERKCQLYRSSRDEPGDSIYAGAFQGTPIAYLQNIRVEQAKRLLLHSKLKVEEIAFLA